MYIYFLSILCRGCRPAARYTDHHRQGVQDAHHPGQRDRHVQGTNSRGFQFKSFPIQDHGTVLECLKYEFSALFLWFLPPVHDRCAAVVADESRGWKIKVFLFFLFVGTEVSLLLKVASTYLILWVFWLLPSLLPFWPLNPVSITCFFRIPDPGPIFLRA